MTVDESEAPAITAIPPRSRIVRALDLITRYWATSSIVAAIVVAGVATGALWTSVSEGSELFDRVAYGLPALEDGRVWTFFTGMFFAPQLVLYVPIVLMIVVVASAYERRIGHLQTLVVAIGGQFLAGLITALLLWPFADSGWTWAAQLATKLDLGISAGGFALLGALTAVMTPVWRVRFRVGFLAYLIAMLLRSGLLWDVEHLLAFIMGLAVGPLLAGSRPKWRTFHFDRRAQRGLVALIVAVTALTALIEAVFPGNGGPFHGPIGSAEQSTGLTLSVVVFAILLILAADGLRRGRRLAWAFVVVVYVLALIGTLVAESSAERVGDVIIGGSVLLLTLLTWRSFSARTRRRSFRRAGWRLLVVAAVLLLYTAVGFIVLREDFVPVATFGDALSTFFARLLFSTNEDIATTTTAAKWFVRSIGWVWIAAILATIVGLIYSSRRPVKAPDQDERLRRMLNEHYSSSIQLMLTWRDITVWFDEERDTAIGFVPVGSVALCLGDPVGPVDERLAALRAFDAYCFDNGWIPCLFAAGEDSAGMAPELGWNRVEVAEDSVMMLEGLEFKGKKWQDVRTAINKAGKASIGFELSTWTDSSPVVTDQLRVISDGWVGDKALPEMGFTLGTLREAEDPDVRLALAMDEDRTVEGFLSWMPVSDADETIGWTLDLMRGRTGGFRGVMEYLIGESALTFKDEGYQFLSLSAAPLARAPESADEGGDQVVLQRLLNVLGGILEPYYGFRSLFAFKQKFQPVHHPIYLLFPDSTALAEIVLAVVRAYVPDATPMDWVRMGMYMVKPTGDSHTAGK
ncbi:hypothetical protein BH10ACT3_BH10ACT3_02040 [soil metagenome]